MQRRLILVLVLAWVCWLCAVPARADDDAITISDPSPANEATLGSLNPPLSVAVRHRAGKAMEIKFRTDASGRWEEIAGFARATSGTFRALPQNILRRGETYRWSQRRGATTQPGFTIVDLSGQRTLASGGFEYG